MIAVYNLINTVITIYIWLLIAMVILSLLVTFNMVNTGNRFIYTIGDFLHRQLDEYGVEPAWEYDYCPIVSAGPNSPWGHVGPTGIVVDMAYQASLLTELRARRAVLSSRCRSASRISSAVRALASS
jgi:hypothetical protein